MSGSVIVHGPLFALCDVINRSLRMTDVSIYPSSEFRRVGLRAQEAECPPRLLLVGDIVAPWHEGEAATIFADHAFAVIETVAIGENRWALKLERCDAEVAPIASRVMEILRERYDALNPGSVVAASPPTPTPTLYDDAMRTELQVKRLPDSAIGLWNLYREHFQDGRGEPTEDEAAATLGLTTRRIAELKRILRDNSALPPARRGPSPCAR